MYVKRNFKKPPGDLDTEVGIKTPYLFLTKSLAAFYFQSMKTTIYNKLFFVYMITIKGHQMNYVGVTNDFDKRRASHLLSILNIVKKIRNKTSNISCRIPAHMKIAIHLAKKSKEHKLWSYVQIQILDIFDNPHCAAKSETKYIKRLTTTGFNLNIQKVSSYTRESKNFIIRHPIKKKEKNELGILIYQNGKHNFFSTKPIHSWRYYNTK